MSGYFSVILLIFLMLLVMWHVQTCSIQEMIDYLMVEMAASASDGTTGIKSCRTSEFLR